jgi:hypothetical protein
VVVNFFGGGNKKKTKNKQKTQKKNKQKTNAKNKSKQIREIQQICNV